MPDGLSPVVSIIGHSGRKVRATEGVPLLNGKLSARANVCRRE